MEWSTPLTLAFCAAAATFAAFPGTIAAAPRFWLAAVLAGCVAAGTTLVETSGHGGPELTLRLDSSEEPLYPTHDSALAEYRDAIANFGDDDLFVVAMHAPNVFTSEHLTALRRIGNDVRRIPGVRSVESIVETTLPGYDAARDLFEVARFVEEIPSGTDELDALRRRAAEHRLVHRRLVAADGSSAALYIAVADMPDAEFIASGITASIGEILARETDGTRSFSVTGRQYVKEHAHHIMVRDLLTLIPIALVVGALAAWIAAGRPGAGLLPVASSAVATLWVYAAMATAEMSLNIITLVLGPVLLCVGGVYGVHVAARDEEIAAAESDDRHRRNDRIVATIRAVRLPVGLAAATTMIGFAALSISPTPAVRELSRLAVLGIAAVAALTLGPLPAALAVFSRGAAREDKQTGQTGPTGLTGLPRLIDAALSRCAAGVSAAPGRVIAAWAAAALAAVCLLPSIRIDTDYLAFFDRQSLVRQDFARIGNSLAGPVPIYVSLEGPSADTFREPDALRGVARLKERIASIEEVSAATAATDLLSVANRALERGAPAEERIPDTRGAATELYFLIPKIKLRPFANANQSRLNIIVRLRDSGSATVKEVGRKIDQAVTEVALPAGTKVRVTGSAVLMSRNADAIAGNQLTSVSAAAAAIALLVAVAFRSVPLGLTAIAPNIVPVLLFFGALGAGAAKLSLPTGLLGCIALGIAVDDTAHFLAAFHERRGGGMGPADAARDCIATLGRPIVVTSIMLSAGFLVLGFSGFATLRELGRLAAMTMAICLAADLTLLPALLLRADRGSSQGANSSEERLKS